MKKIIIYVMMLWSALLMLNGCGQETSGIDKDYYKEGKQEVVLGISYESNMFFAKEDMDIYIDNHKFYTVSNGDTNTNIYKLTKGTHVLKVASGVYHYAAEKFTVKNTGDCFAFSIKNHMSSVNLTMNGFVNKYEAQGLKIPDTADDSSDALSEEELSDSGKNKTIWSYLWIGIKCIFIFCVLALAMCALGMCINAIFAAINAEKVGLALELVGICIISFFKGAGLASSVVPVIFLIMLFISFAKIKKIPKKYRNFSTIKNSMEFLYAMLYSIIFVVGIINFPKVLDVLPFHIRYVDRYLYVYIAIIALYVLFLLQDDLGYPEKVRVFVEERGVITEKEIEEFVLGSIGDDFSDEAFENGMKNMTNTLKELAKINLIERDDTENCFRKRGI